MITVRQKSAHVLFLRELYRYDASLMPKIQATMQIDGKSRKKSNLPMKDLLSRTSMLSTRANPVARAVLRLVQNNYNTIK